jgi:very-short-patch-repair endonuclease
VVAIELGFRQLGVFARWQLTPRGVTNQAIQRRVETGAWVKHLPGVYGLPSAPESFEQRVWIAWLAVGPGAVISHEAAAQLRGIPNVVRDRVTLIVPHSYHQRIPGVLVHQISDVSPDHCTSLIGLPVTTVPRTIVDLAAVVHPSRLRHIVEDAKFARLTSYDAIGMVLADVSRRGKPGVRPLTRTIDLLTGTKGLTQSTLESALVDLLVAASLPPFVLQHQHPGRLFTKGCTDVSFIPAKLIVEADGRTWHTRIQQLKRDHERDAEAARAGWDTLRLLHEHIVGDPEGTAMLVADILRARLLLLAS